MPINKVFFNGEKKSKQFVRKKVSQHFLKDINIAKLISDTLTFENYNKVIEIGPGMGILTQFLISKTDDLNLIEIDKEAVKYLVERYPNLKSKIIEGDFLKFDLNKVFETNNLLLLGTSHTIFQPKLYLKL